MRNYDKYRSTKFIQKGDVGKGILVTIAKITDENVAPDYQAEERKYVIYFQEDFKPWAPGIETLENIKQIAGTGNVDDWSGTKIVLFVDPDVKFGGKKVGGIRCRAPKNTIADLPKNQPETQQDKSVYQENPDYVSDGPEGICPHCQLPLENCSCKIPF